MAFEDYLDDPLLREMHAYWRRRRGPRAMPSRRDIDPADLPRLLPHLLISEVLENGQRFRYRLAGMAITEALGRNPAGCLVEEIATGAYRDYINDLHRQLCRSRRPLFADSACRVGNRGKNFFAKRLMLPLSDDGAAVNQILSLLVFHYSPERPPRLVTDTDPAPAVAAG